LLKQGRVCLETARAPSALGADVRMNDGVGAPYPPVTIAGNALRFYDTKEKTTRFLWGAGSGISCFAVSKGLTAGREAPRIPLARLLATS